MERSMTSTPSASLKRPGEHAYPTPTKKYHGNVNVFRPYLNLITDHQKNEQFVLMETEIGKNVDPLLTLKEANLPNILHDFYELLGNEKHRNTQVNIVYSCTPLITYIHKYFNPKETSETREMVTLYMLARLMERLILLIQPFETSPEVHMIVGKDAPRLPNPPFEEESNVGGRYRQTMREMYGLDLTDIIVRWGLGNANDFLIHVMTLTSLTALDYYPSSYLEERTNEGAWKCHMGIAQYNLAAYDRDTRTVGEATYEPYNRPIEPINQVGYSLDAYILLMGDLVKLNHNAPKQIVTNALLRKREVLNGSENLRQYPLFSVFPNDILESILGGFQSILAMRKLVERRYQSFVTTDTVDYTVEAAFRKADMIMMRKSRTGYPSYYSLNKVYSILPNPSLCSHNVVLEKRVSAFVGRLLWFLFHPDEEWDEASFTVGATRVLTIYDDVLSGGSKYDGEDTLLTVYSVTDEWSQPPGRGAYPSGRVTIKEALDKLNETKRIQLLLRCVVVLALDLTIFPFRSINRLMKSFMVNVTMESAAYAPFMSSGGVFASQAYATLDGRINYHGALIGDNRYRLVDGRMKRTPQNIFIQRVNGFTDMKCFWQTPDTSDAHFIGIGSNSKTAMHCLMILSVLRSHANTVYDIVQFNDTRFLGRVRESRDQFLKRIEGLFTACQDLHKIIISSSDGNNLLDS